jgi:hypothetical protein
VGIQSLWNGTIHKKVSRKEAQKSQKREDVFFCLNPSSMVYFCAFCAFLWPNSLFQSHKKISRKEAQKSQKEKMVFSA